MKGKNTNSPLPIVGKGGTLQKDWGEKEGATKQDGAEKSI